MGAIVQQQANVETQIEVKKRELRRLELTLEELERLPSETNTYVTVGRMYVLASCAKFFVSSV
jgi:prefoldin subunit 1